MALCSLGASSAMAANETIGLSLAANRSEGPLYREVYRPVDASLAITVNVPARTPLITPLKSANVTFPADMDFFPDPKKTPTCSESKLNEQSNLASGVASVVSLCPRSVVGTGTAVVQLAQQSSPGSAIHDPKLIIFNAGRDGTGRPKITIYGYSKTVNTGLLMHGTLARDGQLKIDIGVLPFDSSVSQFTLGIPGDPIDADDTASPGATATVAGQDPSYLRAKCSTGAWRATGDFLLGNRVFPSGASIGEGYHLQSNPYELSCEGRRGKARLGINKVRGPRRIVHGRRAHFVATIRNSGTATARLVRLRAFGAARGNLRIGKLPPGSSRKVRLALKASGRKGKRKLTLRVTAAKTIRKDSVRKLQVG